MDIDTDMNLKRSMVFAIFNKGVQKEFIGEQEGAMEDYAKAIEICEQENFENLK